MFPVRNFGMGSPMPSAPNSQVVPQQASPLAQNAFNNMAGRGNFGGMLSQNYSTAFAGVPGYGGQSDITGTPGTNLNWKNPNPAIPGNPGNGGGVPGGDPNVPPVDPGNPGGGGPGGGNPGGGPGGHPPNGNAYGWWRNQGDLRGPFAEGGPAHGRGPGGQGGRPMAFPGQGAPVAGAFPGQGGPFFAGWQNPGQAPAQAPQTGGPAQMPAQAQGNPWAALSARWGGNNGQG